MTPSIFVKPEPPQAQSSGSYHLYFLKQRQLLQTAKEETLHNVQKAINNKPTLDAEHRERVIAKMKELAASIDVRMTIIPPPSVTSCV